MIKQIPRSHGEPAPAPAAPSKPFLSGVAPSARLRTGLSRAFSLLETLLVLAVAAGVAAWALGAAPHLARRTAEARARSDVALLHAALLAYRREFGDFPPSTGLPRASHTDGDSLAPGTAEEALREALLGRLAPNGRPARAWIVAGAIGERGVGESIGGDSGRSPAGPLPPGRRGVFADPWGRPYVYGRARAEGAPLVYSVGYDGEDGPPGDPRTEDNLHAPF